MDLTRKAGERVSEFCTRYRSLVADLKGEGVLIGDAELGWWLRQKMGLDPLRKQLLDTALQGSEDYGTIEAEILRLFRDLHDNDPLYRRMENRQPLTIRRMFGARSSPSTSSAPSTFSRMTSASSMNRPSSLKSSSHPRQANVTENVDEDVDADAEVPAGESPDGHDDAGGQTLEEILQTEAEVLAAELHEAEQEGVDPQVLDSLESGIEQAAETLVTMREARQQLQSVRKDRGYGKSDGSSFKHSGSSQAASRKASGKFPCYDCGESGHWGGDSICKKPGQGLGRKKPESSKKPMRQVRVAEHDGSSSPHAAPNVHGANVVEHALPAHDVLVTEALLSGKTAMCGPVHGSEALNLEQALTQSVSQGIPTAKASDVLPPDKELVGALDSACNRTCAGPDWLRGYLLKLQQAPNHIKDLVQMHAESENFRFGNNGVVPSLQRWRLPALIGETLVLVWISMVPVSTLGCLIGRDLLESIGAVLDFHKRPLTCNHIASGVLQLRQMVAGHFLLELLPSGDACWSAPAQETGKVAKMWSRWCC